MSFRSTWYEVYKLSLGAAPKVFENTPLRILVQLQDTHTIKTSLDKSSNLWVQLLTQWSAGTKSLFEKLRYCYGDWEKEKLSLYKISCAKDDAFLELRGSHLADRKACLRMKKRWKKAKVRGRAG